MAEMERAGSERGNIKHVLARLYAYQERLEFNEWIGDFMMAFMISLHLETTVCL